MVDATHKSLRERVDQEIGNSGSTITDRVVSHFVDTEVKRRADLIVSGINLLRQAELDHRKIKPDQTMYDAEGTVVHEGFSKGKLDEKKKHAERIEKIQKAIDQAIGGDLSKLDELVKKG